MKRILFSLALMQVVTLAIAQSPVGKWKMVSHTSFYEGQKMDTHAALLTIRPCAGKIVYEVNADGSYRLNAAATGCDESYRKIQERLYSKTKWRVVGDKISISATNFEVGQTYTLKMQGSRMIWTGTDGQGTIVYQKL